MELTKVFDYNNENIIIYNVEDEIYFKAKDVAKILEYRNTRDAINKHVDDEDKKTMIELGSRNSRLPYETRINEDPQTIFINESGLYTLIIKSNKPEAKQFKRWITSVVLPSIRKTGQYQIPRQLTEYEKKQIDNKAHEIKLSMYDKLVMLCPNDDRDKVLIADSIRNTLKLQDNDEWSVSRRLSEYFNITSVSEHKKLSSFGKSMKKKYVELHNINPSRRTQYVNGSLRSVYDYNITDWIEFGDELMKEIFNINENENDNENDNDNEELVEVIKR